MPGQSKYSWSKSLLCGYIHFSLLKLRCNKVTEYYFRQYFDNNLRIPKVLTRTRKESRSSTGVYTSCINNLHKIVLELCNIDYILCGSQEFSACRTMWTPSLYHYATGIDSDEDKESTNILVKWKMMCSIPNLRSQIRAINRDTS